MARQVADILKDISKNKSSQDDLAAKVSALEKVRKDLDAEFTEACDSEGLTGTELKGVGKGSIETSVVPQASSWDDFYKFIHRNKFYHLLERRPSVTGCRELWEQGKAVPGVDKFSKRKVKFVPA